MFASKSAWSYLGVAAYLFVAASDAKADIITTLYDTGVGNNGAVLAGGAVDPHYALISSADPGYPGPNAYILNDGAAIPSVYIPNSSTSKWIAPSANVAYVAAGNYVYQTTFNLTGFNPATAEITGQWTMDDNGPSITLNGINIGVSQYAFAACEVWQPFTISSGFVPGINTLDFTVGNAVLVTGLRVEMTGTASVPEPGVLQLLSLVVVPFALFRYYRWRKMKMLGACAGLGPESA
jgi:hypothetical protein